MRDYIKAALVTLSPSFHGELVSKAHFTGRMNGAIDALNKLDQVKKSLFYGRDNNLNPEGAKTVEGLNDRVGGGGVNGANILHAIIGIATEAGELLEALRDDYNGNGHDAVNLREEVGDLFWYVAILAHEAGFTFSEAQTVNIEKLAKRYPDKFTEYHAVNRDLAAERAVLEADVTAPGVAEAFAGNADTATLGEPGGPGLEDIVPANTPLIVEQVPASGKTAVEGAAASAAVAFDHVQNVGKGYVERTTSDNAGELAKSPAARMHLLPGEKLARQPVRPEDV